MNCTGLLWGNLVLIIRQQASLFGHFSPDAQVHTNGISVFWRFLAFQENDRRKSFVCCCMSVTNPKRESTQSAVVRRKPKRPPRLLPAVTSTFALLFFFYLKYKKRFGKYPTTPASDRQTQIIFVKKKKAKPPTTKEKSGRIWLALQCPRDKKAPDLVSAHIHGTICCVTHVKKLSPAGCKFCHNPLSQFEKYESGGASFKNKNGTWSCIHFLWPGRESKTSKTK